MLNTPRTLTRPALVAAGSALLVASGLTALAAAPAAAEPSPRCTVSCGDDGDDSGSDAGAEDGAVTILVWGSGTTSGDEGYEIPGESVTVLPPCRYYQTTWSGKEYYDGVQDGSIFMGNGDAPSSEPYPNYEAYKDDTEGRWWSGMCDSGDYDGSLDEFLDYSEQWFDNEFTPVYVRPGEPTPVPPIPPEVLVEVAYDEMTLPDPQIGWNPRRDGDGATVVNVPTWMWLEDGPVELEVHAEAGENEARVDAVLSSMNFSASNAAPVSCDGHGVAWTSGGTSDCALTFTRSSASQPGGVSSVLAESQWSIEWFANGEPRGPLDPQTTSATFELPVAEVQAIVVQ